MSNFAKLALCLAIFIAGMAGGWKAHVGVVAQEKLKEAQASAKETQRRLDKQQENQIVQNKQLAVAKRDAAGARSAADGLQQRIDKLSDPATVANCPAVATLGDALSRSTAKYRELASAADLDRAAGLKCEADYDGLTMK